MAVGPQARAKSYRESREVHLGGRRGRREGPPRDLTRYLHQSTVVSGLGICMIVFSGFVGTFLVSIGFLIIRITAVG